MKINQELKNKLLHIVKVFNVNNDCTYNVKISGKYLYLSKLDSYGADVKISRLQNNGNSDNWGFAVFKYSSECYDPNEMFFPGFKLVDGTIEGALKAGLLYT